MNNTNNTNYIPAAGVVAAATAATNSDVVATLNSIVNYKHSSMDKTKNYRIRNSSWYCGVCGKIDGWLRFQFFFGFEIFFFPKRSTVIVSRSLMSI